MKTKMKHHPEQLDDEIYMGNVTTEDVSKSGWGFGRRGGVAHNSDGEPFASKNLTPWFLKVSEVQARIDRERRKTPRDERAIELFQNMINKREAV